MTDRYSISLPLPPSTNNLYRNVPGKGRVKTKKYTGWIRECLWELKAGNFPKFKGHYEINICVLRKDRRKRDLSNFLKPVEDLLVRAGIVEDDSLCMKIEMEYYQHIVPKGSASVSLGVIGTFAEKPITERARAVGAV